ncbi:hypothetical protein ACH5RR_022488 [Cinchona calisaya]|uniref:Uncharacterized protein n=1 Tax=Cinchona calisaya TaxID=153742 RepID=A0ABD2Z7Y0_9GENT
MATNLRLFAVTFLLFSLTITTVLTAVETTRKRCSDDFPAWRTRVVVTDSELGSLRKNELSFIDKDGPATTADSENFPGDFDGGYGKDADEISAVGGASFDHVSFSRGYVHTRKPMSSSNE